MQWVISKDFYRTSGGIFYSIGAFCVFTIKKKTKSFMRLGTKSPGFLEITVLLLLDLMEGKALS
jgi:hypothetical protein